MSGDVHVRFSEGLGVRLNAVDLSGHPSWADFDGESSVNCSLFSLRCERKTAIIHA